MKNESVDSMKVNLKDKENQKLIPRFFVLLYFEIDIRSIKFNYLNLIETFLRQDFFQFSKINILVKL